MENRIQIQNPKSKRWVKIDTEYGRILGYKNTPWKNIKRSRKKSQHISIIYELNNKPIKKV